MYGYQLVNWILMYINMQLLWQYFDHDIVINITSNIYLAFI